MAQNNLRTVKDSKILFPMYTKTNNILDLSQTKVENFRPPILFYIPLTDIYFERRFPTHGGSYTRMVAATHPLA